jgi:hypothetical protein
MKKTHILTQKVQTADRAKRKNLHRLKIETAAEKLRRKLADLGDEALLDEYETAEFLKKSVQWLRNRRIYGGSLPFIKIGAAVRYRVADLKASYQRHEKI